MFSSLSLTKLATIRPTISIFDSSLTLGNDIDLNYDYLFIDFTKKYFRTRDRSNVSDYSAGDLNNLLTYTSPSTKYVRNASSVLVPGTTLRIDHDVSGNPIGLLIEEQKTNLVKQSEAFVLDNNPWQPISSATATQNVVIAPDGNTTADKLIEGTSTSAHYIEQRSLTASAGIWTASCFFKAGERSKVNLVAVHVGESTATSGAVVDVLAGTITSATGLGISSGIQDYGNGWYRAWITYVTTAAVANHYFRLQILNNSGIPSYTGDGSSGFYIWGAQVESGYLTSYIKTTTATVTRAADVITLPTTVFPWSDDAGTVIVEMHDKPVNDGTANNKRVLTFGDGTLSNHITLFQQGTSGNLIAFVATGGTNVVNTGGAWTSFPSKIGLAFADDDWSLIINGGTPITDASGLIPSEVNKLYIGNWSSGTLQPNTHIKSLLYIPERLSNSDIQALTA